MYLSPVKLIVIALLVGFFMHSCTSKQAPKYPYTFEEWAGGGKTRLLIKQDGKYGYAGLDSSIVIPMEYDSALYFNLNAYTLVQKDGQWGVIDENGRVVVDCAYDSIQAYEYADGYDFRELLVAIKNKEYCLLDTNGSELLKGYTFLMCLYNCQSLIAKNKNGYSLINSMGQPYTPDNYTAYDYNPTRTWISLKREGRWELYNNQGRSVLDQQLDSIDLKRTSGVTNGIIHKGDKVYLFAVKKDGFWGGMDREGKWIIPNKYAAISYDEQESEFVLTPVQ